MWETLGNTLTPFVWGVALALVLNAPMARLEARLGWLRPPALRRGTALGLVLLGLAGVLALVVWLLAPQLWAALTDLAEAVPRLTQALTGLMGSAGGGDALTRLGSVGTSGVQQLWQAGMGMAKGAADVLGQLFVALVLAVYLLAGRESVLRKGNRLCRAALGEARAARVFHFCRRAAGVFSGFIAGQCLEACILAGLFVLALLVCRMPYVLPISAVIGVTALVPVFGAWVGCAVGVLLLLPVSLEKAGWFVVVFVCVQQLENNAIYPRVVGGRIGLPPLWVLAAVLVGGGLFGLSGLVLGIPATSVLYQVGGDWVRARLDKPQDL